MASIYPLTQLPPPCGDANLFYDCAETSKILPQARPVACSTAIFLAETSITLCGRDRLKQRFDCTDTLPVIRRAEQVQVVELVVKPIQRDAMLATGLKWPDLLVSGLDTRLEIFRPEDTKAPLARDAGLIDDVGEISEPTAEDLEAERAAKEKLHGLTNARKSRRGGRR